MKAGQSTSKVRRKGDYHHHHQYDEGKVIRYKDDEGSFAVRLMSLHLIVRTNDNNFCHKDNDDFFVVRMMKWLLLSCSVYSITHGLVYNEKRNCSRFRESFETNEGD